MDKCTKIKIFNCLLLFCATNFFLYRYFSRPDTGPLISVRNTTIKYFKGFNFSQYLTGIDSRHLTQVKNYSNLEIGTPSPSTDIASLQNTSKTAPVISNATVMLPPCPLVPPRLNGPLATYSQAGTYEDIRAENEGLMPGGRYKPPDCTARHRVAIVIPYRNREEHLKILLRNLHPMLARQQLDYGIFVIDQALPGKFNRAMLMNIGYTEAMKRYDYQCAIFHDVDLIPENDRNIYSCPEMPRHLSAAIDKFNYRLPYDGIYGGVSAINKEHFQLINGFSNMFFGWGGEDDDMASRIRHKGLKITRYPMEIARYRMIKHSKDSGNEQNPQRFALLKTTSQRIETDGLNSLVYSVEKVEALPTHLRIVVLINEKDIIKS
ncbi:unnamed protein product [Lymnaea stagnalis]|uniref:Beta-1,4-galactosyltransferase n=1 Tax=Lymnaea stagnalis TaxID=6523 RepID=A0AAV2H0N0_LYMST